MDENEAYMIPECNLYRTKVFSQELTCKRPLTQEPLPMANFDSAHHLELKMMHARERLAARIENEGYLICAELKRLQQNNSSTAKNMIKEMLGRRIDALWLASAADYVALCTLSYLSSVPENAKPYDRHMLDLMKKRDELPEDSEERAEILAEIEHLDKENKQNGNNLFSVNPKESYDFYVLGGDITEQLNKYMRQTEIDYDYMHGRHWVENLLEFKSLVDDFSVMDLKRQPEWQHSALIYDGEIIDRDAPGNINYGYFGTFCNIPKAILLLGAGYAQIRDGNSAWDYWLAFFDDPRDTFRVLQGIDIYNLYH